MWYKYFVICEPIWVYWNTTGLFLYLYRSVTHSITLYDVTGTGEVKEIPILRDIAKIVGYPSFNRAVMPLKWKKKRHSLEAAAKGREILKQARVDADATVSPAMEGVISENEARAADSTVLHEEPGPSRPPVDTTEGDVSPLEVMEAFVEGWVQALDHEDRKSLAMLLCFVLVKELSFTETNAAALTARVICKNGKGHIPAFLPKFHPKLTPIERVWAQLKRYTKAHCKYSIQSLRNNIPNSYDSVSLENIQNHFRKVRHFMYAYLEGLQPGKELDETIKKYKVPPKDGSERIVL